MIIGDRVKLNDHLARAMAKRGHNSYRFNWLLREGVVKKLSARGGIVGVQWSDRNSLDWFADHALVVLPNPPAPTDAVSGHDGESKAASPLDPNMPGRTKRPPPIRMKRLRRGARSVV